LAKKQRAEVNGVESDVGTLERHYRVTLDFRVLAREITAEVCQESFLFNDENASAAEPQFRENIERQRRLYRLLRENRQVLEQYILSVLTQEAGNYVYGRLADAFDVADEDELLVPLYRRMTEEDARFFEESRARGVLAENTELIAIAFKAEWVGAEVAEMNRRVLGDVKRAEIVERTKIRLIRTFRAVNR
jgi:hypothetical protein